MGKIRDFLVSQAEPDFEQHLPYAGHLTPNVVMLFDGTLLAMVRFRGIPYELALGSQRNGRTERINTMARAISDPDISLHFHLVRHQHTPPAPQPARGQDFVGTMLRDYERVTLSEIYTNDWFLSVMIHPAGNAKKFTSWLPGKKRAPKTDIYRLNRLSDALYIIMNTLEEYGPERLGTGEQIVGYEDDYGEDEPRPITMPISEIGSALYLIRTAQHRDIPHTSGALASAIYTEPVEFLRAAFKTDPHEERYGAMITFLNYPGRTRAGMFNALMGTEYPLVMSHSFRFLSSSGAVNSAALTQRQMEASGDRARSLKQGLDDAMDRVASQKAVEGAHHFTLAVYAPSLPALDQVSADARHLVQSFGGAAPTRDENIFYNGAMASAYWLQLPGASIFQPRPGKIDSACLANMASLDGYATGHTEGYWGPSPLRFKTNGGTAYDWVPHDVDVPHSLVIGRIGSGKTVLLGFMLLAMQDTVGPSGVRLLIDKDESNRLSIEAAGGVYQKLRRGVSSGLAPLIAFQDSPRVRAFLHRLYTALILRDQRSVSLTSLEDQRLARGIARQMKMPPEKRSMGGIREFLGYENGDVGAGARFERWCAGGSMGWLLDNKEHTIQLDAGIYGIDLTELLPRQGLHDDGSCAAAAAVITEQLEKLMDGRRIVAFFDECRFYLKPLGEWIEDLNLTGRKKEVWPCLVFQEAAHAVDTDVGKALVAQMRSKYIFPDASHNEQALRELQMSPAAIRMLKGDMTIGNARRFLLWRNGEPVICEFDLSKLPQLRILSGRPQTIILWEDIKRQGGGPEEFLARLENNNKPQRRAA